jgi:hypothetical protein
MGTFHNDKGELHGISVVVDTLDERIFVGRCHELNDDQIVLLDAAEHRAGADGCTKQEFVGRIARYGIPRMHGRIVVSRCKVASVRRLGDVTSD